MPSIQTEAAPDTSAEQRHQVQIASQPRLMGAYLRDLFADAGVRGSAEECRILDMKYEPGQYCTTLYQLGGQLMIGTFRWGAEPANLPESARVIAGLGMQVYQFQHDPALPGLATALDGDAMRDILNAELPECRAGHARVLRVRARPLRYRPGRRCTLRFDMWLRDTRSGAAVPRTLFGKVYHDLPKATSVYHEMQMIADSAPARDGRMIVAGVAAFLPELQTMLQEPVPGEPLELWLEGMSGAVTAGVARGWDGVLCSAEALAALHTAGLTTARERPIDAELKRFAKRAGQAAQADPAIGAQLQELAAALPAWRAQLRAWDETITLIHGDCKHSQCMVGPDGVAILDFDHCGMADPATDIATYTATLRQLGLWQALNAGNTAASAARTRWLRALEDQFLDTYCVASGFSPAFRLRVAWYEAAALMRKALRGFARSPRSAMPLAQVEEAWRILATLPPAE